MESCGLESVLNSSAVKILDTNIILRDRESDRESILLRHLYDCKSLRDLFSEVLNKAVKCFENSYYFFNFPQVYFTEGIIKETNYVLECVDEKIDFFKSKKKEKQFRSQKGCEEKEELLLETQEILYQIISRMRERKISFENNEGNIFTNLRGHIISAAEKNKLKIDSSLRYNTPKSRKVKDYHTAEEIVATGLILSQKGRVVKIISEGINISNIVNYVKRNYEILDSGLFKEIKGELQVFRPNRVFTNLVKTEVIPRFSGERFGEGLYDQCYSPKGSLM